jgi:hypothetical protein
MQLTLPTWFVFQEPCKKGKQLGLASRYQWASGILILLILFVKQLPSGLNFLSIFNLNHADRFSNAVYLAYGMASKGVDLHQLSLLPQVS